MRKQVYLKSKAYKTNKQKKTQRHNKEEIQMTDKCEKRYSA